MSNVFNLEPHFERVILQPDPPKAYAIGGITLETESTETVYTGTVIALGPLAAKQTTLKAGQKVMYQKFAGQKLEWDGIEYRIILANDILLTIHDGKEN